MQIFNTLPAVLPQDEPYYYLSAQQESVCRAYPELQVFIPHLPCWIPHRRIADALGFSHRGIENALQRLGRPYVWGTEFENVHAMWNFDEPRLTIDGQVYSCSESYYHSQKPKPFNAPLWDQQRDGVMRTAVRHKFTARPELSALLLSTAPHPLFSIKSDRYWGVTPDGIGENKLAVLLMALRTELQGTA